MAQNALCISCEYSLSDFNVKSRFVTSALYELPFGRGHNLLNHGIGNAVLGGWQIGGIGTVQSGLPLNFAIGVDRSNTAVAGSGGTRPNATGVSIISPNPTTAQWFNLAALKGRSDAIQMRREVAELMSEAEVAAAQREARDWISTH